MGHKDIIAMSAKEFKRLKVVQNLLEKRIS